MSDPIIIVENLGKKYLLRHQQNRQKYLSLREVLMDRSKAVGQRFLQFARSFKGNVPAGQQQPAIEDFWALRDVSFEINRGESVGIIGRNGAGKSTLLKILSRITEPTTGKFRLRGRMASLLEVGTGFHPELTGRENIYLNGSVLGMTRTEIKRKFDEIVAFAEIEKFLDTPVKRYSSGMYVRLAFAVAAHLEPEILVVDEVLAVGDAEFQRKCIGKMGEVAKGGRTVLFVSHNLDAIASLCSSVIVMEHGRNSVSLATDEGIQRYLSICRDDSTEGYRRCNTSHCPIIGAVRACDNYGAVNSVQVGGALTCEITLHNFADLGTIECALVVTSMKGQRVLFLQSMFNSNLSVKGADEVFVRCEIPNLPLLPDTYIVDVMVAQGRSIVEHFEQAMLLDVRPFDIFGNGNIPDSMPGFFALPARWSADYPGLREAGLTAIGANPHANCR
jgi:lipopolysaccharide transport system ATP-binding protein